MRRGASELCDVIYLLIIFMFKVLVLSILLRVELDIINWTDF